MKKELILAIVIGLAIGFGLAAVFWSRTQSSINLSLLNRQEGQTPTSPSPAPETTNDKTQEIALKITEPENEIVHTEEELTIIGETGINATVVIIWEEGEDILVADENGEFQSEITLVGGENRIDITAYADDGTENSQTLTITYSTAEF